MGSHKVASCESRVERQLTCQYRSSDDTREEPCIVARGSGVCAAYAEQVEHGGLRLEDRTTADGADFNRRHGDGDAEVAIDATNALDYVCLDIHETVTTYFFMMVIQLELSTT